MHTSTPRRRAGVAAATAFALAAVGLAAASPVQAATATSQALAGSQPAWATAQADRGAAPSTTDVTVDVYLNSSNPAGLAAYAAAVSNPDSSQYHQYLTPAQQNARFGATGAQVSAVQKWLAGAGLKVGSTTEQYVVASGSPTAIHAAFGTTLNNYSVSGHTYYAPNSTAVVPAAVASAVLGVDGLTDQPRAAKSAAQPVPAVTTGGKSAQVTKNDDPAPPYIGLTPCATYYGQSGPTDLPKAYGKEAPSPVCGYLPNQLRDAYGVDQTNLTGKGSTVAVVDAYGSPTIASDAATFDSLHGIAPFKSGQFSQVVDPSAFVNQDACGDWTAEESLDVESVHTMAPGAKVVYVGANSCFDSDFIAAEADIVDNHLASIVTNSWDEDLFDTNGNEPVATINEYNQVFEQGAVEGIGFYFSSGDCSTDDPAIVDAGLNCDTASAEPQVTFPASSPWVTGVGATAIGIGKSGNYQWETGMGDSEANSVDGTAWSTLPGTFLFGTGGGTSNYFTQPWYQSGVVPTSLSKQLLTGQKSKTAMREVPDVAMEGDLFAATMVGFTQELPDGSTGYGEAGYGGTSVASPLFAGIQADAQQAQGGWAIGFANPEIYLRDQLLGSFAFHDVTDHPAGATEATAIDTGVQGGIQTGLLFTIGSDWTLHATRGYDDVTGVGSPTVGYLRSF